MCLGAYGAAFSDEEAAVCLAGLALANPANESTYTYDPVDHSRQFGTSPLPVLTLDYSVPTSYFIQICASATNRRHSQHISALVFRQQTTGEVNLHSNLASSTPPCLPCDVIRFAERHTRTLRSSPIQGCGQRTRSRILPLVADSTGLRVRH